MSEDEDKDCLNLENNSKYCFFKVANAFLLLVVFLQFVILCFYAPRVIKGNSLGFDYIGVIVGILAILVTFLVAWQIWATLKSDEKIMRFETDLKDKEAQLKQYIDNEITKERQTRECGILFQAALKTIEEKRYLDALMSMCMIVSITDIESFIQGAAHHIHVIIRDHQKELGDKEKLREELQKALNKFKQIGVTCNTVVKTIEQYLNTSPLSPNGPERK